MVFPSKVISKKSDKGLSFILYFVCPMCGREHTFQVDADGLSSVREYYNSKCYAQDLPFARSEREKLISGYCDECQKVLFDSSDDEEEE